MGKRRKMTKGTAIPITTDRQNVPGTDKVPRRYTQLIFLPGIFAPCIIATALFKMGEDGFSLQYALPLIAFAGWLVSALWAVLLRRSLVNDISPWLVLPLGMIHRIFQVGTAAKGAAQWSRKMVTKDFRGQSQITSSKAFVPRSLDILLEHDASMQRLRRMKDAVLGWNHKRVVFIDWYDAKHLLIQGSTGVGKTTIALTILLSMLGLGPSVFSKWRFHLHDAKRVMGYWFLPLSKMFPDKFVVHMEMEGALQDMRNLYAQMEERSKKIGLAGGKMTPEDAGLDRILVMIDEPQMWYDQDVYKQEAREYEAYVKQIVNAGRQAGFHVVLITPYALREVINTQYRGNLRIITGHLKKNTIASHGISSVLDLAAYEFLYEENPIEQEVFLRSFMVDEGHRDRVFSGFTEAATREPDEMMLHIFATVGGAGYRTIQKVGRQRCEAQAKSESDIPFPFSKIKIEDGKPMPSRAAKDWVEATMRDFVDAGIAEPQGQGKPFAFKLGSYAEALAAWREYRANKLQA